MDQHPIVCTEATRDASASSGVFSRSRRWLLATLGVVSVGLAVVGAILPGMPATVFLIIASYCFARSCPWLEERLLRHRIFAPYLPYLRQGAPMPRRARVVAAALMWGSIMVSLAVFGRAGSLTVPVAAILVGAALAGTVAIVRFRRTPVPPHPDPASETPSRAARPVRLSAPVAAGSRRTASSRPASRSTRAGSRASPGTGGPPRYPVP